LGCASPLLPVRARLTGVTPGSFASDAAFCGSVPPTCMRILRPVIGLVDCAWWGACHSEGVIPVRGLHVSVASKTEFDSARPWEKATGASVLQHVAMGATFGAGLWFVRPQIPNEVRDCSSFTCMSRLSIRE